MVSNSEISRGSSSPSPTNITGPSQIWAKARRATGRTTPILSIVTRTSVTGRASPITRRLSKGTWRFSQKVVNWTPNHAARAPGMTRVICSELDTRTLGR